MAKTLTKAQKATWDAIHGLQDETLKSYADGEPGKISKYMRIQRALNHPAVKFQPVVAWRNGPGEEHDKWEDGVDALVKFMPLRRKAIERAMDAIEKKIGEKVYWGKMTFIYKITYTRYQADVVLGADVLIEGTANKTGTVNYYYDNARAAEGAHRWVIINGKKDTI